MTKLELRIATPADIAALYDIAARMKAVHEKDYFERLFREGRRTLMLASEDGAAQGYVILNWEPSYPPFRRLGIPEIQDLNVAPDARRRGLGAALVTCCEEMIRAEGIAEAAISVGLSPSFGAAQRLYVRLGYIPDGAGVAYDDVPVAAGEMRAVDGLLTLKMVKTL
jgi:ribosomal protein S18 acetylase RimI-like enzyme